MIKKADKGATVVILYTSDYLREVYRQLDHNFYKKIDHDMTPEVSETLKTVLDKMLKKNLIDEQTYEFLNIKNPKPCNFYMLPKIHK